MEFTKMHGAGNDYVYIDARSKDRDWNELSRLMSDRHFGVGGDGLILVRESDVADLKMSMYNSDGSEAEMCGNGIRCFVKYAVDRGIVSDSSVSVSVETLAGIRQVAPISEDGRVVAARVSMGNPILAPADVPVKLESAGEYGAGPVLGYPFQMDSRDLPLNFVSMGNPHAVCFMETPIGDFELHRIGPLVENHTKFPKKMNFHIANIANDGSISMRSWERGAGETWSCGSGACAAVIYGVKSGILDSRVNVHLNGGDALVEFDGDKVFLSGPGEFVYEGSLNLRSGSI